MKEIIDVFRMEELQPKTRAKIIIQLGRLINDQFGSNITEPIVYELVSVLEPENPIIKDEHFIRLVKP